MNAKEIIAGIKKLLFEVVAPLAYKLVDGTEIMVDSLAVGGSVTIAGAPASANDYTLEDKTILKVDADGKITEVIAPAADQQMEKVNLKDGTILEVSAWDAGSLVMVNGSPAAAGDWELADGRIITVDAEGKIVVVKDAPVDLAKQANDAAGKFATGTPEERLGNLEIVAKAVMQNVFGWRIQEEQVKAITEQAIAVYKTGLESQVTETAALKIKLQKQDEVIKQLLSLAEALAKEPGDEAPTVKRVFSHQDDGHRGKKFGKFLDAAKKMAEEQTV